MLANNYSGFSGPCFKWERLLGANQFKFTITPPCERRPELFVLNGTGDSEHGQSSGTVHLLLLVIGT